MPGAVREISYFSTITIRKVLRFDVLILVVTRLQLVYKMQRPTLAERVPRNAIALYTLWALPDDKSFFPFLTSALHGRFFYGSLLGCFLRDGCASITDLRHAHNSLFLQLLGSFAIVHGLNLVESDFLSDIGNIANVEDLLTIASDSV